LPEFPRNPYGRAALRAVPAKIMERTHRKPLGIAAALLIGSLILPAALASAQTSPTWDGLVSVKAKRMNAVYLAPGADFRPYTKVMFDPTEVALKKGWLRDYNLGSREVGRRLTDADVQRAFETVRTKFAEAFTKAYTDAGYQVVTAPGPDVLRVRTAVVDLRVNAPDKMSGGRTRSYAQEAGAATLVLEARDSESGEILGRALDRRLAGDTPMLLRNSITNKNDFSRLFNDWAKKSVAGLAELKTMPVVAAAP
jgi:hypothetical protein